VKALLLPGAPRALRSACSAAGIEVVVAPTAAEGRDLLGRDEFTLVDGRLATPRSLEQEIQLRLDAFFARLGPHDASGLYAAVLREVERPLVAGALARAGGVRAAAAEALGIDRGTLARRLKALGLEEP
jgi:Fis family transcriptional regulator, factor for inversion stimulation protein